MPAANLVYNGGMPLHSSVDVAIVGAGAAGIGAAIAARDDGLCFVVVEAMDRIGGRAFTDTTSIGVPWDHGCHWLHSASINPLVQVADALGLVYERPNDDVTSFDGRWASETGRRELIDHFNATVARGAAIGASEDVALSAVMARGTPYDGAVASWLVHAYAHPAEHISTVDLARYTAASTDEDWPLRDGYGTLFARLAAGLPIVTGAPVTKIAWGGDGAILTTASGTIRARAVVITASTNVLADEVIAFDPPLPLWKREALAAAPLGAVNKIAIRFSGDVLRGDAPNRFAFTSAGDGTAYWLRPFDTPVAIALLGGPLCRDLARQGHEASLEYVREQLASMFGSAIRSSVAAVGYAMWTDEPFVRGSYAGMLPGQGHRRDDLALPVGDTLFFAGEATVPDHFATAHGAYASGRVAIDRILRSRAFVHR